MLQYHLFVFMLLLENKCIVSTHFKLGQRWERLKLFIVSIMCPLWQDLIYKDREDVLQSCIIFRDILRTICSHSMLFSQRKKNWEYLTRSMKLPGYHTVHFRASYFDSPWQLQVKEYLHIECHTVKEGRTCGILILALLSDGVTTTLLRPSSDLKMILVQCKMKSNSERLAIYRLAVLEHTCKYRSPLFHGYSANAFIFLAYVLCSYGTNLWLCDLDLN
jgi:hypothetical protein